jgi:hypothetical protein
MTQHIMSARYSVHIVPFLCIAIAMQFSVFLKRFRKPAFILIPVIVAMVIITNAPNIHSSMPGDPGFREAAEYLRNNANQNARILSWYPGVIKFYLPEFKNIDSYNSGGANEKLMELLRNNSFDYIILYHNQVKRWPNDSGIIYIKGNYTLEKTFNWKDEPVLWIYKAQKE